MNNSIEFYPYRSLKCWVAIRKSIVDTTRNHTAREIIVKRQKYTVIRSPNGFIIITEKKKITRSRPVIMYDRNKHNDFFLYKDT